MCIESTESICELACVCVDGKKLSYPGHPPGRNNARQSQPGHLRAMRKHRLFHQRQTCEIDVVAAVSKGRLGHAIAQRHHRSGAIDDNRAPPAKTIQRARIENVDTHALRRVASADKDLSVAALPQFGDYYDASGSAIAADHSEYRHSAVSTI